MTETSNEDGGNGRAGTVDPKAQSALEMEAVRKVYEVADEEVVALDHAD